MARINLLPWRQEARERKNREFITLVAGVLLFSLLAAGAAWSYFNNALDSQKQANEKIKQENSKLDKQLTEIDSLEKQRDEMLSRMKVIQDLQGRRPIPVRVWSDIAKSIPPQMYLTNMKREGDTITFRGKADNPNVVATFIRNLDASPWLENSAMKSIMQPQATPYTQAPTPQPAQSTPTNPASPTSPAPRPIYPEDNYIEFVVTSTVSKSSDVAGSNSSTATTKVVTTTTTTSATASIIMSAPSSTAVSTASAVKTTTVTIAPPPAVVASAPAVPVAKPVTAPPPVSTNAPISNAPISNAPVVNSMTTTTTHKE